MKSNASTSTRRKHISHKLTDDQKGEIVRTVCDRIANGEYLVDIAADEGMPHANTIRNWIDAASHLNDAYNFALKVRSEILSELAVKATFEFPPLYKDARGQSRIDPAGVQLVRLRVMALQWLATAHLRRRKTEADIMENEPKFSPPALTPEEVRERMNRLSPFLHKWIEDARENEARQNAVPPAPASTPHQSASSAVGSPGS